MSIHQLDMPKREDDNRLKRHAIQILAALPMENPEEALAILRITQMMLVLTFGLTDGECLPMAPPGAD